MFTELDAEQAAVNAAEAAARAVATAQAQARAAIPGTSATNTQTANAASAKQSSNSTAQASDSGNGGATVYQWLLAWLVVIVSGILIARTRVGYALLYYMAALSLLFLLLTNAKWIQAAVKPITGDTSSGLSEPGAKRQ